MNPDENISVFLLIGQSNMAGRGRMGEVPELRHPRVFMFRDGGWLQAVEPLHTDKPDIAGVGLAMSFAATLLERTNLAPIGLVPCAVGGARLARWMPDGDLYPNALSITKAAMKQGELKGILWHQGEDDASDYSNASSYGERFCRMIHHLRRELAAPQAPVIAGELGTFFQQRKDFPFSEIINQQLRELRGRLPAYALAGAEGLEDNGDNVHFNSASLREFGLRYAEKFLELS